MSQDALKTSSKKDTKSIIRGNVTFVLTSLLVMSAVQVVFSTLLLIDDQEKDNNLVPSVSTIPQVSCDELELDSTWDGARSRYYENIRNSIMVHSLLKDEKEDGMEESSLLNEKVDDTLSHSIYFGNSEVLLFIGGRWIMTYLDQLDAFQNRKGNVKSLDLYDWFYIQKAFRPNVQPKGWVAMISEKVYPTNDNGTPIGLRWYFPRTRRSEENSTVAGSSSSYYLPDLTQPEDVTFQCVPSFDKTNNSTTDDSGITMRVPTDKETNSDSY